MTPRVWLCWLVACAPTGALPADAGPVDAAATPVPDGAAERCVPQDAVRLDARYHAAQGVDPARLSLDLSLPDGEATHRRPLVIYVHGGGWRSGDKRNGILPKRDWAHGEDWAFATVNYRLSPADAVQRAPDRVTWPTHADDVARAVHWLLERADEHCVDAGRVALVGFSAGANLAASVANVPQHLGVVGRAPDAVSCAVVLDTGVVDDAFIAEAAGAARDLYLNAFTEDPSVWVRMSPRDAIDPSVPRPAQLVVTRGLPSRQSTNGAFVTALRDAGFEAALVAVPELSHGEVNAALGAPGDTEVTPPVTAFLRDCFRAP